MGSANVGKVFNTTGGGGGSGTLKLDTLTITKPPQKTIYKSGESFDPTGMVVTAGYGYGITSAVTGYSVSPQVLTDGVTEVVVTYTEGRITKMARVSVTVQKVLVSISVTRNPSKMVYRYMEVFAPAGMTVTAKFTDNSTEVVSGYTYPKAAFSTLGSRSVEIGYTYEGVTKTTSLNVTVDPIELAVPVQNGVLTYDGTGKTPSWTGYDPSNMTISGTTNSINAGTYSARFHLSYGYRFTGGLQDVTVEWVISRATIASLPVQNNVLAANGKPQSPTWDNYNASQLIIGGDQYGTDAGDYTATFTPTSNYKWWDGSVSAKSVKWQITRVMVSIPTQKGVLTYTGAPQKPEWDNFDLVNSKVQVTMQTNAGTYSATFILLKGMWSDGSTTNKTVQWTIGRAAIARVPAQSGTLKYDGNPKTPQWNSDYDPIKMTVSVEAMINAGTGYSASFTPTANYKWWDDSVSAKIATWVIGKGDQVVSVSPTSVTLNPSTRSAKFTVTRKGDGVISAASNNNKIVTIGSINQQTGEITVNSVNDTAGNTTITIRVASGTNYQGGIEKEASVNAKFTTIYGVEWDWTSGGLTRGKRTDGAADFDEPKPACNNGSGSSPFDKLYPWKDMTKVTRTGGVMVKEPKYWYKWTKSGKKLKLQIADGPVAGFHVDPVNMDRGDGLGELDCSYIGRYHCANGTYKSETNSLLATDITRSTARSRIHGLGKYIWQMDFAQFWYIGMLFLVEFADWDGERIGRGCSSTGTKSNSGLTDAMKYHTGTIAPFASVYGSTQYRNIEGWWDNVQDWLDGCYYNDNGLNIIKNPSQFSDDENGVLVGKPSSGYPTELTIPSQTGFEWALFPIASGGSVTTYIPDQWIYSPTNKCLIHGGAYQNVQNVGPFYIYPHFHTAKVAVIGCRLQERPPKA